ncbi:MAG TPA: SirA family protein [Deltaproteobacteria bacterium]|nr:SirA family protein [Deltaproteobacteria bacterium]
MIEVDVKGLSCPIPVVKTKKAMEENPKATISVLVDSNVAKENVTRLAESKKYSVKVEEAGAEEVKLVLKPSA